MDNFLHNELTWIVFAAIIFAVLFYKKIAAALFKTLDTRRNSIEHELDEALSLKEQAKKLLSEARHKQKNAEIQAEKIITHAREEADIILKDANRNLDEVVERRTRQALEKISHYENAVIQDIKHTALDMAIEAVRNALVKNDTSFKQDSALQALDVIQKKMN